MIVTYFLTGSYNDVDNDFELAINTLPGTDEKNIESKGTNTVILTDNSSENKILWQTTQPSFMLCLSDLDEFIIENNISFYSKVLTSSCQDDAVDEELEDFILKRLKY